MKPKLVLTGTRFPTPRFWSAVQWQNRFYGWGQGKVILVVDEVCYEYRVQYQTEASK